jgi:phosphoribosylglycinamide formyltransferase-1
MKIVILGSGNGSNAQAILESFSENLLGQAVVQGIFSDVENSGILKYAEKYGIHGEYIYAGRSAYLKDSYENDWINQIKPLSPDLIVLAGFMRIIKRNFISEFNNIINLHPSLLPSFPGLNSIRQAYEKKVKITGCTVHWVNEKIDDGEIIAQAPVRVMKDDSLSLLTKKIHAAEHMILPSVIRGLSNGEIKFPK